MSAAEIAKGLSLVRRRAIRWMPEDGKQLPRRSWRINGLRSGTMKALEREGVVALRRVWTLRGMETLSACLTPLGQQVRAAIEGEGG